MTTKTMLWAAIFSCALPLVAQDPPKPAEEPKKTEEPKKAEEVKKDEPAKAEATPPAATGDEPFKIDLEAGYRVLQSVNGHFNTYRTLVNLGEGPRLRNAYMTFLNPSRKYFDRLTVSGSGLGDPFHTARVTLFREAKYDFNFDSRAFLYYNFLPSFANPLLERGILTPQRAYDVNRQWMEGELRLRPGHALMPYFAFSRDTGRGTGITNFYSNGNEYPVFNQMSDTTTRFRGGLRLEKQRYHLAVEQGGTNYDEDQNASTRDRNAGNRTTPLLGQNLFLSSLDQVYRVTGDSLFTNVSGSATVASWMDVTGQFLYVKPKLDTTLSQTSSGNFATAGGFPLFFTQEVNRLASQASMPHTSGVYTFDIKPIQGFRILHSLWADSFNTAGAILSNELTRTPAVGTNPVDTSNKTLTFDYNRMQTEGLFDFVPGVTVRVGHRYSWGDASFRGPQASGIDTERPALKQHALLAGIMLRKFQKLWLNADVEQGDASQVYFRTSLDNYKKATVRVRYQMRPNLHLGWNTSYLDNKNPTQGIRLDSRNLQNGLSLYWNPKDGKRVTVMADYTHTSLRSNILYLVPTTASEAESIYRDNAHVGMLMLDVIGPKVGHAGMPMRITAGGSHVYTSGSRPSRFPQPEAKLQIPLHRFASIFGEWRYYGYGQPFYRFETFRSHQFMAGFRMTR